MRKSLLLITALICSGAWAQDAHNFTRQDTLRGSITPERAWWDLNFYHLKVSVEPDDKFISGSNTIRYEVLQPYQVLQVDLQAPLTIEKVTQDGQTLEVKNEGNAHFVTLKKKQIPGDINQVIVHYSGHPKEAVNAPWDGGFSWKKDAYGQHFIATSCQGLGASVWWPNKDHMYDEVDSMKISITVPEDLMDVSNGQLLGVDHDKEAKTKTYHWGVENPINNYGVNLNVADYVHFDDIYNGEKGELKLDFYVLKPNLEKAKKQFTQAAKMLEAFEYWFGPYPFYEDGFKLVEVPYLGMEHQSSVTYGNGYENGYRGNDVSGSGWGLKFDFIIIHESAHEWFANNITYKDMADMWIHESFTSYSENLYVDYYFGKEASKEYVIGIRDRIANDEPIIGHYDVNDSGSADMYYKGANMLHTLRQLIDDDQKWRQILRGLNEEFYHQTVTTKQIEDYMSEHSGIDLSAFFNQYLRTAKMPKLQFKVFGKTLKYRYVDIVEDFDMPVRISINAKEQWIQPNAKWQKLKSSEAIDDLEVDENFYIKNERI